MPVGDFKCERGAQANISPPIESTYEVDARSRRDGIAPVNITSGRGHFPRASR
jgi:hypothetical protein